MAKKRFTDIEIWDKEWYMELSPKHKCLMKYIFDKCDASGCWKPNWKLASLHINDSVNLSDLKCLPKDQYEILENGKIFIPDFIKFQYGTLSKKSPAHNPVFSAIEKNGLSDRVSCRLPSSPKEEDKEEEEEKDKEKEDQPKLWFLRFYHSNYETYKSVYNGKSTTPEMLTEWKGFIDFIYENKFEEIMGCKFITPHDFAKLIETNIFPKEKWGEVLKSLLSTGIKPEHNLFFRIPKFIEYGQQSATTGGAAKRGTSKDRVEAARNW